MSRSEGKYGQILPNLFYKKLFRIYVTTIREGLTSCMSGDLDHNFYAFGQLAEPFSKKNQIRVFRGRSFLVAPLALSKTGTSDLFFRGLSGLCLPGPSLGIPLAPFFLLTFHSPPKRYLQPSRRHNTNVCTSLYHARFKDYAKLELSTLARYATSSCLSNIFILIDEELRLQRHLDNYSSCLKY
jgi:hypothetical protein